MLNLDVGLVLYIYFREKHFEKAGKKQFDLKG